MTKLHISTTLLVFLTLGQLGCDDSGDDKTHGNSQSEEHAHDSASHDHDSKAGAGGAAAGSGGSSGGAAGGSDAGSAEPGTFSHIYEVAFKTCRTQCHGMNYSMLDMKTRDMAYSQLVDHDSNPGNEKCAALGLKRVKPGSPDESLLYRKLDIHAPCGQQMPPGGQLMQSYRDEIRDWIMNGAKDN